MRNNENIIKLGTFTGVDATNKSNTVVFLSEGEILYSYDSLIAIKYYNGDRVVLGKDWNYSSTTSKYRNLFLEEDGKETKKKLSNSTYILDQRL